MLKIIILASGPDYQRAAAFSAATFALQTKSPGSVSVLVPKKERHLAFILRCSKKFKFSITDFHFSQPPNGQLTTHLKCAAYASEVAKLPPKTIALFVDADTCCTRPVMLQRETESSILEGRVALVRDILDRHASDPSLPWYLPPHERSPYVNAGVLFAGRNALPLFQTVLKLSKDNRFLNCPLFDQTIINFVLGRYFPDRLIDMDSKYNAISSINKNTMIAHFAGGAGLLGQQQRRHRHEHLCGKLLAMYNATIP